MSDNCPYERKTLFIIKGVVEVVLITWSSGCVSKAHDHGEAYGLIKVVKGTLFERRRNKSDKTSVQEFIHEKGATIFETPDIEHIMGNVSSQKKAQSLHVYMPPPKMTFYDDF